MAPVRCPTTESVLEPEQLFRYNLSFLINAARLAQEELSTVVVDSTLEAVELGEPSMWRCWRAAANRSRWRSLGNLPRGPPVYSYTRVDTPALKKQTISCFQHTTARSRVQLAAMPARLNSAVAVNGLTRSLRPAAVQLPRGHAGIGSLAAFKVPEINNEPNVRNAPGMSRRNGN